MRCLDRYVQAVGLSTLWRGRAAALPIALLLAYLIPGIIGHDPWKQDEAYTFGMVLHMLETDNRIVPTLGGQPFMEKPPLFFVTAAATATLFSAWLPLHDGARLAATLWIAFGLWITALAARRLNGDGAALRAALYLVGSIGLLQHAHEMITDTSLFAGIAMAVYGLTWAHVAGARAGSCIGTGVGIGFLSKGLVAPAMIGLACCLLPLVSPIWRTRTYGRALAVAALFALPWLSIWPLSLFNVDRDAFDSWLWINNVGRYTGTANLGADPEPFYYLRTLPWFTFPAGIVALIFTIGWIKRGSRSDVSVTLPLIVAAAIVIVLTSAGTVRSLYAMPLLIPLTIVAARIPFPEHRWVTVGSTVFASLFALLAIAMWWIWLHTFENGRPPKIDLLLRWLPEDFEIRLQPAHLAIAISTAALWLVCWCRLIGVDRHLYRWVAGVAMVWGTAMSLHLPWLDQAKSFRQPFAEMAAMIQPDECLLQSGLGEPQRGMLHYIAGIVASDVVNDDGECRYLLVQTNHGEHLERSAPLGWQAIWQGARPGERDEAFTLYERNEDDYGPLLATVEGPMIGVAPSRLV